MTHEDAGHYAAKHPSGTTHDPEVAAALRSRAEDSRITCADAFATVEDLGASPSEIGKTLDLLEYRITRCQLGLFGYSPEKKIVKAADKVDDDLRGRLLSAAIEGALSCATCWDIAEALDIDRMAVAAACERLGLKIAPCQLGAF